MKCQQQKALPAIKINKLLVESSVSDVTTRVKGDRRGDRQTEWQAEEKDEIESVF